MTPAPGAVAVQPKPTQNEEIKTPTPNPVPELLEEYTYHNESPTVILFEMQNAPATVTLKWTVRARPGETDMDMLERVKSIMLGLDTNANVAFTVKDKPEKQWGGKGGGQRQDRPKSAPIGPSGFEVTKFKHIAIPKKDKQTHQVLAGQFWHKITLYGANGEFADAWGRDVDNSHAFAQSAESYPVDVEQEYIAPMGTSALVAHAEDKPPFGYTVTQLELMS